MASRANYGCTACCSLRSCWRAGFRFMNCGCSACLRPTPHDPATAAPPDVANALQQLPEITLEQLDAIIPLITHEVDRLDPASTSSSSQVPLSQHLGSALAQWEEQKQICTSFINSQLPKELTNEVAGNGKSLLMPLLTRGLSGAGGVHWLGLGFAFIAWSLDNVNNINQNREDLIGMLRRSLRLLRDTKQIWQATNALTNEDLQDSVEKACRCAVFCTSNLKDSWILRFVKAATVKDAIAVFAGELDRANIQNVKVMQMHHLQSEAAKVERQITFPISRDDTVSGWDREKLHDAVTFLQTSSDEIKAVFLHGMGGIGKSFLGMKIFTQLHKGPYRACRVELQLEPKQGELCDIQRQILEKVCKNAESKFSNLVDGRQHLKKELKQINDPIFLYVDNVLEHHYLTELLPKATFFPKGSRILITSRGEYIKHGILDLGITDYMPLEVRKLPPEGAQHLFWENLASKGEHRDVSEVESLEKRVLALCDGLPLALLVVGRYIANEKGLKNVEVWREVVEAMQKAEAFDGGVDDKLYSRIKFSIEKLEENVKRAFLDMTFLLDSRGGYDWKTAERLISHKHIKVLCQRALVRKSENNRLSEIHDVLKAVGSRMIENDQHELRIRGRNKFEEHNSALEKVVALDDVTVNAYMLKQLPRLRLLGDVVVEGDCQEIQLRHLRVVLGLRCSTARALDWNQCAALKEICWIDKCVPNLEVFNCGQIPKGLEALALGRWTQLKDVDVIETLLCLKELQLWSCDEIESLPEGISSLTGLKQLELFRCAKLKGLPQGISRLTCLELLHLSDCESIQSLPDGLTSLTCLTELGLRFCRSLQSIPEGIGNLRAVTQLQLQGCESLESIPEGATSLMSGLTKLSLDKCTRIEYLPQGISRLTGLKMLSLRGCISLRSLPEGVSGLTGLTSLKVEQCRRLRALPEGIESLIDLIELDLGRCTGLQPLPNKLPVCLTQLDLSGLQMQSFPDKISELTGLVHLDLSHCRSLQSIEGVTTLTALITLKVDHCRELQLLPERLSRLTSLRYIGLSRCMSLKSLPQSIGSLTQLEKLDLGYCTSLESLPKAVTRLSNLAELSLLGCRSLDCLPSGLTRSFTGLRKLKLEACGKIIQPLLEEISCNNFPCLELVLLLSNCEDLQCLPQGITSLTGLRELSLSGCGNFQCLPQGMANWRGLTRLNLWGCGSLQSLPEELTTMTALSDLSLSWCACLRSLPQGIFTSLTALEQLSMRGCGGLQLEESQEITRLTRLERLDLSESEHLLFLLSQQGLNELSCLSDLNLSGCRSLQALPEGMTALQKLDNLDVSGCGSLQSLTKLPQGSPSSMRVLNLAGCGGLDQPSVWETIVSLKNLFMLSLSGWESMQALPEQIASLQRLVYLDLSKCSSLQSLPEGVTMLTSLQALLLAECKSLRSLLPGITRLVDLKCLDLSGCTSLEPLPEEFNAWIRDIPDYRPCLHIDS